MNKSWIEKIFAELNNNPVSGYRYLHAVTAGGGFALFSREGRDFKIVFRSSGFPGRYDFLEKDPESWMPVLERGSLLLRNSSDETKEGCLWIAVDKLFNPDHLVVAEVPCYEKDVLFGEMLRFALIADMAMSAAPGYAADHLPVWLESLPAKMEKMKSPLLIVSETGSGAEELVNVFVHKKFKTGESGYFFSPGRLSEAVQLREIFGDPAGARLGDAGTIVSALERGVPFISVKEAGFLSLEVQRRILRVLEERGSVFWIFETERDLAAMVEGGEFLSDLEKKLKPGEIILPPLRNCRSELIDEAEKLLSLFRTRYGRKISLDDSAKSLILSHPWPRNWVQFRTVIETSCLMCREDVLTSSDLRFLEEDHSDDWGDLNMRRRIEELEKSLILKAYSLHGGNQVQMSRSLGISRGSLQYKMNKYHLSE